MMNFKSFLNTKQDVLETSSMGSVAAGKKIDLKSKKDLQTLADYAHVLNFPKVLSFTYVSKHNGEFSVSYKKTHKKLNDEDAIVVVITYELDGPSSDKLRAIIKKAEAVSEKDDPDGELVDNAIEDARVDTIEFDLEVNHGTRKVFATLL